MITDNNLFMSSAQAVTATAASTKSLDMATALRNVGSGEPIELIVQVQTTADAVGAGTVTVSLDDSAALWAVLQGRDWRPQRAAA